MVKDHSDSERKPAATLSDYLQGFFYMHHPIDRIIHTTAFVTPDVEHWLEPHDWCNKGHGMCYPVCGDGAYKRTLAHYQNGP